jgi:hypothetical protein
MDWYGRDYFIDALRAYADGRRPALWFWAV